MLHYHTMAQDEMPATSLGFSKPQSPDGQKGVHAAMGKIAASERLREELREFLGHCEGVG